MESKHLMGLEEQKWKIGLGNGVSENQLSSGQIGHERSEDPSSAEVED